MTRLAEIISNRAALRLRTIIWLTATGVLVVLLTLLTKAISDNPSASQDIRVMNWIVGWDLWGLTTFLNGVAAVTHTQAGLIYGSLAIISLLLLGKTRPALVFAAVGLSIAAVALAADFTLGEIVGRGRPLNPSHNAFPSGHVYGTTVFFSFIGFLTIYFQVRIKILIPILASFVVLIVSVGLARIHLQAHFPSDVAGGYLMAAISLLVIIPAFLRLRRSGWMATRRPEENYAVVASAIGSSVVLDPEEGSATKVYTPPSLVRLLYWVGSQAKLPYAPHRRSREIFTSRLRR